MKPNIALLALAAVFALASPAAAQISTEERLCLADYLRVRNDADSGIPTLRTCATRFPDSYQIQRTFGLKLRELALASDPIDAVAGTEAVTHLRLAADLDPDRFAGDWKKLGDLCLALGRANDALTSYANAEAYLTPTELQDVQEDLWVAYREAGDTKKALEVWERIWHRHEDDFEDQLAAGRLYSETGQLAKARDCLRRAVELRPAHAAARALYLECLLQIAETGTAADKKELVTAYLPQLVAVDDGLLARLLAMALATFETDAARTIGEEMLARDPKSPLPNVLKAESLLAADDGDGALAAAQAALGGGLPPSLAGRAHAVVGRVSAERAYRAYSAAGGQTSKGLVDATAARYREALAAFRRAEKLGTDVARDVGNVQTALGALGGAEAEYATRLRENARKECERLGPQALLAYDQDKPMLTTARGEVALAPTAGGEAGGGRLAAGTKVALRGAAWLGAACWVEVKAPDGTSGWARQSKFD